LSPPYLAGNVPKTYKEELGRWVQSQRACFKIGKMDPERKSRLDKIGFDYNRQIKVDKANKEKWNFQFQKLREYYEKHGA
jgi:hypothetical protein